MRRQRLGQSGLQVSALTLGTLGWGGETDAETAREHAEVFIDGGGTSFDSAHSYRDGAAESLLGQIVGTLIPRHEAVLITKAGLTRTQGRRVLDTSRGQLLGQLESSLSRMRTDYVDLWLVQGWSEHAPLEETISALASAVDSGKARYVGVSNYLGWQLARAYSLLELRRIALVANEVEYSLLVRDPEIDTVAAAAHLGVGLLASSPLARGALSGKYRHTVPAESRAARSAAALEPYLDEAGRAVIEATCTAADGLGVSPAEVALAWVLQRPGVCSAVLGTRTTAQLATNLDALDLRLPPEVAQALDDVSDR